MLGYKKVAAILMRAGTSKGVYLLLEDLPKTQEARDRVILEIYGSPDMRQINGVGGADPLTSKVALIAPSEREGIDVDYTFGYVGIEKAIVDYDGNCGNMSAGVGPFAIMKGLVQITEPFTTVRIYNTNTQKVIEAQVPVQAGEVVSKGDYTIAGVPGSGAKITLNFPDSAGSKTGKLLPTGKVVDEIILENGKQIKVSIVDAANPAIFVQAKDLGLTGTELPSDTQAKPKIIAAMEEVRRAGAVLMGLAKTKETAGAAVPKVAIVAKAQDYMSVEGAIVKSSEVDLVARTLALDVMHKTYAVTGGICLATAALIGGTVVNEIVSEQAKQQGEVRIGHPAGCLEVFVKIKKNKADNWQLEGAGVARTARAIMDGYVYVPSELM